MKSSVTLKENRDFRRLYSRGKYAACSTLVLYWRPNRLDHNRLGITVSTKLGHAVVRNKIRRRIREIYRLHEQQLRQGMDLVVVARSRAPQVDYWKLDRDFQKLARKLGIWKETDQK
ncbi:MAG: ribonuclease P protein component [Candidatus Onthomonas sp.]